MQEGVVRPAPKIRVSTAYQEYNSMMQSLELEMKPPKSSQWARTNELQLSAEPKGESVLTHYNHHIDKHASNTELVSVNVNMSLNFKNAQRHHPLDLSKRQEMQQKRRQLSNQVISTNQKLNSSKYTTLLVQREREKSRQSKRKVQFDQLLICSVRMSEALEKMYSDSLSRDSTGPVTGHYDPEMPKLANSGAQADLSPYSYRDQSNTSLVRERVKPDLRKTILQI